jgi:hypothetical protein
MKNYLGVSPSTRGPGYPLQVLIALRAFHYYPSRGCRS